MFTLQDLLNLPLMQSARPHTLVGDTFDQQEVRWVHTSEIFEISPLLKGGEVLLTTGLGLVGAAAGSVNTYIAALAQQNVTALIMEVGRTFIRLPDEFVTSAREHQLPLITLHRVIPFVEITEVVHPILISRELQVLRDTDHAFKRLTSGLLAGDDLADIVSTARSLTGLEIGCYSPGAQLLAGTDVRAASAPNRLQERPVGIEPWAYLVALTEADWGTSHVLDVAATAIALKLSQKSVGSPSQSIAVTDLLADMMTGKFVDGQDLETRAGSLGFTVMPQRTAVGVAVDLTHAARTGLSATTKAARKQFGPSLVAEVDGHMMLAIQVRPEYPLDEQLATLADSIDQELATSGSGQLVRVTSGPVVDDVAGLATSIPRAGHGAKLARRLALMPRILTERDLGLYDLLTRVVPDSDLETFVEQQLGALLQADARSGSGLMVTLNAYLETGRSKSAAAKLLGIQRQTMYQRLERISRLLGGIDLSAHNRLTALDLAVTAWQMRTSGLTGHD